MCKHSQLLTEETCSICTPRRWVKPKVEVPEDLLVAEKMYEEHASSRKVDCELWENWEFEALYTFLKDTQNRPGSLQFRKEVLELSVLLDRSFNSVMWHYKDMFIGWGPEDKGHDKGWKFRLALEQQLVS